MYFGLVKILEVMYLEFVKSLASKNHVKYLAQITAAAAKIN